MRATKAVCAAVLVATAAVSVLSGCSTKTLDDTVLPTVRGGTLHVLTGQKVTTWDPQQMDSAPEGAFAVRTFLRTLTTQAPSGVGFSSGLTPDLASTTGHSNDGGRTWQFSVVSSARWQDDRLVTCEDIRYGVSRTFDPQVLAHGSAGARYAVQLLDIPSQGTGASTRSSYQGPYVGTGQVLFDKAVSCAGQQLTFRLKVARQDFPQIVSLPAFGPYRQQYDPRLHPDMQLDPTFAVFSSGPYMLEGAWVPGEGGRFVRNRKWKSFIDPIRLAWPDVIEVDEATSSTAALQRIVDASADSADSGVDRTAVTWASAPQGMLAALAREPLSSRVTHPDSLEVDTLLANPSSRVLADPVVRRAFAAASDREAYAAAFSPPGASQAVVPTASLIARNLPGHPPSAPTGSALTGAPAAARAALVAAAVALPVRLTLSLPKDAPGSALAGVRSMQHVWQQAGFAVAVASDGPDAASMTQVAGSGADVVWGAVTAAVPTAGAALESVYDAPQPAVVRGGVVAAVATAPEAAQTLRWSAVDAAATEAGWQVPLGQHRHTFVHGSGVESYTEALLLGGYVDLAITQVDPALHDQ